MDHVLRTTYFSQRRVENFLECLIAEEGPAGKEPCSFWKNVAFLNKQAAGASQAEMLGLLDRLLMKQCGLRVADCGREPQAYVYLDDVTCTGNRIRWDIVDWVQKAAPEGALLHINR